MKQTSYNIKVDTDLLKVFLDCCDDNDMSGAQVMRNAMRAYINENKQLGIDLRNVNQIRKQRSKK